MAEVPVYELFVTVGDSAKKFATVSLRVDATDGKAYVAAADKAARDITKVGILQLAIFSLTMSAQYYAFGLKSSFINDAFVYPAAETESFNSNKLNISYATLLGGLPRNLQFTIPQRNPSTYEMESNGINVVLADADDVAALVAAIADTMLSIYGTAATVSEITVNDE